MFWPYILPVQITFVAFSCLFGAAIFFAPSFSKKRRNVTGWGLLICVVGFVPSCMVVNSLLDNHRFGIFSYPHYASVKDDRVYRYLPIEAKDITIEKYPQGFRARFYIGKNALNHWFDGHWENRGKYSVFKRQVIDDENKVDNEHFVREYGDLGWSGPKDMIVYEGPRGSNGAGFTLWFSESKEMAFQRGGYW